MSDPEDRELIDLVRDNWEPKPLSGDHADAFDDALRERIDAPKSERWIVAVALAAVVTIATLAAMQPSDPAILRVEPPPEPVAVEVAHQAAEETVRSSFKPSDGGVVLGDDGVRIDFEPGVIRDAHGQPVQGPVEVTWDYVATPEKVAATPIDLVTNVEGRPVPLRSFGMVHVDLHSEGEEVFLDGVAEVSFPMVAGHDFDDGAPVGLYHYDEEAETWTHEGNGRNDGGRFVAEVRHFSWWNADVPIFATGCIKGRLTPPRGQSIDGMVQLVGMDYLTRMANKPDAKGDFCVDAMPDAEASVEVIQRTESKCYRWQSAVVTASAAGTSCTADRDQCTPVTLRPTEVDCEAVAEPSSKLLVIRGSQRTEEDLADPAARPGLCRIRSVSMSAGDAVKNVTLSPGQVSIALEATSTPKKKGNGVAIELPEGTRCKDGNGMTVRQPLQLENQTMMIQCETTRGVLQARSTGLGATPDSSLTLTLCDA